MTNTKKGWFGRSSEAAKAIKKATDSWAIGDSVKLENAVCANTGAKTGRKLLSA